MIALARRRTRKGFTLVEILVVVVVIAILAAVVLPKFINSGLRGRESALKSDLTLARNALEMFHNDCSAWPSSLADLAAATAPATGLDDSGNSYTIVAANWKGPYLASIPTDPVSSNAITYTKTSPNVGKVNSSAAGNDSAGNPYSGY